jgi:predicted enzyme related to lactoylglutathione lyase
MPVELGYLTLPVKDMERAKRFYAALFGWEFEPSGHVRNTKFPLALSSRGPVELPNVFFKVSDLEQALTRLVELGGQVRERRAAESGPNAICADDQGTVFRLWQPAPGFV